MFCYVGETLPHYDAWRTQEPDLPPEEPEEPAEYSVTLHVHLAAEIPPSEVNEAADALAAAIARLLSDHLANLPSAWAVEDVRAGHVTPA